MASATTSNSELPPTTIETLASRLEQDIRRRGLHHGDRYLTAAEASKLFSVSPITINRAMQLLAERDMLTRQRSRGTFVGPKFQNENLLNPGIDVLHVMMAMDYRNSSADTTDALVDAFIHALPGTAIEVQFLPESTALANTERTVQRLIKSDATEGMVLIRSSRQAQLCVADSRLPAVVMGLAYPGVMLSSIKHDQNAVGRLMAEYAIREKYNHCVLLTRNEWRYGDNAMLDAMSHTLASADLSLGGLLIRSMPQEIEVVADAVTNALAETTEPVIFLCRNEFYANAALETAEAAGKVLGVDFDVISGGHTPPAEPIRYPRIQSELALSEQIQGIVELLCDRVEKPKSPPRTETISVAFQEPDRTKSPANRSPRRRSSSRNG
jgi:DNA-binding LacI/PurR family transcriptional regulator